MGDGCESEADRRVHGCFKKTLQAFKDAPNFKYFCLVSTGAGLCQSLDPTITTNDHHHRTDKHHI